MATPRLAALAFDVAQDVLRNEETPEERRQGYKPPRIVALLALIIILGFCTFVIDKIIYLVEQLSGSQESSGSTTHQIVAQLTCGEANGTMTDDK
jgi:hypothetical protein